MGQGFIKQNGVPAGRYEQLVNYTSLYHLGDEGESGGWVWKDVTNSSDSKSAAFVSHTFKKTADNMYIFGDAGTQNKNCLGGIFTNNSFDMEGYEGVFVKSSVSRKGENTYYMVFGFPAGKTAYNGSLWLADIHHTDDSGNTYLNNTPLGNSTFSEKTGERNIVFFLQSGGYNVDMAWTVYHISLYKQDNWEKLLTIAGIPSTTMDTFLANSKNLNDVLSNKNAVEFMVKQCTGNFMASAVMSNTFLTALNNSLYKEKVYANEHWARFLAMAA